jgi:Tol biopolymer transport system component
MRADGGTSLPLAVTPDGLNEGASWSPDGQKIAFISTRSGSYDIWIMDLEIEQLKKKLGIP